jgi:hypothetical protein
VRSSAPPCLTSQSHCAAHRALPGSKTASSPPCRAATPAMAAGVPAPLPY